MTIRKVVRGGGAGREANEAPSPRTGFARVVESVFAVEIKAAEYVRLEHELALADKDSTRPEVIRAAINRCQRNASDAHRLYIAAKVEFEIFETDCLRYMARFREEAIRELKKVDPGRLKKDITEKDVTSKLAVMFHDQVVLEQERREKASKTVAHLYRLAELWKERAYALSQMK